LDVVLSSWFSLLPRFYHISYWNYDYTKQLLESTILIPTSPNWNNILSKWDVINLIAYMLVHEEIHEAIEKLENITLSLMFDILFGDFNYFYKWFNVVEE